MDIKILELKLQFWSNRKLLPQSWKVIKGVTLPEFLLEKLLQKYRW